LSICRHLRPPEAARGRARSLADCDGRLQLLEATRSACPLRAGWNPFAPIASKSCGQAAVRT